MRPGGLVGLVAVTAALISGCAPSADARIESAGYPPCAPADGGALAPAAGDILTVTVDVQDIHQEMHGFGASDCWSIQYVGRWPLEKREAIADLLFETGLDDDHQPRGIGLSVWRFNIGAGSSRQEYITKPWRRADTFCSEDFSEYDWTRLPGQRWFLQAARARGVERFIAFANSPPIHMTGNGRAYCDSGSGSTNLGEGMEDDFAAYLAEIVGHFREVEGIDFDILSPFNEPQWEWDSGTQEGCRYAASDMHRVVEALWAQPGLGDTEIEIPESGSITDLWSDESYLKAFFAPESATFVGDRVAPRISSHSYGTDLPSTGLVERRQELRASLDRYPGLGYAMTEYCVLGPHGSGRDLSMNTALLVARVVHFDLVIAGASTWQWWLAVSPYDYKDGLVFIDQDPDDGSYFESKTLWALGNFSRFVRPGMVRVGVARSDHLLPEETVKGLMVSSFLDVDRGVLATVFINWSKDGASVDLEVDGFTVDQWIPYMTSAGSDLQALEPVLAGRAFEIPARSIVTMVGRSRFRPLGQQEGPRSGEPD